ncbi:unnamed protein product [Blepharisma stoltei]|uniref:RING-type domain-containing protein n=1 Tax=Blepharisma stoltei TaxID=1481888 RepID=A0AAU9JW15_9CILI|nr:unnamed protein product [Blepharisma stoltei]
MGHKLIFLLVLFPYFSAQRDHFNCPCSDTLLNNKYCNSECNIRACNWDYGDCDSEGSSEMLEAIIIIAIIGGLLIFIFCACFITSRLRLFENLRGATINPVNINDTTFTQQNAANEAVFAIFSEKTKYLGQPICAICLMEFQRGDPIRITKCLHLFHNECIEKWMLAAPNPKCPDCNKECTLQSSFYQ